MSMKGKKILVTGGTGFVGSHLVPELVRLGARVTIVSRGDSTAVSGTEHIQLDLEDPKSSKDLADVLTDVDVLIHLASNANVGYSINNPGLALKENIQTTIHLLEGVRLSPNNPLVVFTSTDRLYGRTKNTEVNEEEIPYPIEPYTASKICAETIFEAYAFLYDISYIALRCDSIYGPGQPETMFVSDVIKKMIHATEAIPVGNLEVKKNFVYVKDVAQACIMAANASKNAWNQKYNIGGEHVSLDQIFAILKDIIHDRLDKDIEYYFDESLVRRSGAEVVPFALSTRKATDLLGWQYTYNIRGGLSETVDYFISKQ